jgi:hypothetical protein
MSTAQLLRGAGGMAPSSSHHQLTAKMRLLAVPEFDAVEGPTFPAIERGARGGNLSAHRDQQQVMWSAFHEQKISWRAEECLVNERAKT